jgi:tRNA(Ile)-lysidine synthase TilS/MesJ
VVAEVPDINDITDPILEHFKRYEWEITPIVKRMKIPEWSKLRKWVDEWLTCQWCTYSRRMTFFKMAEDLWITKIAYWHHKDDIVDTIMMNIVNGSTMNPMPAFNMMKRWNMAIIRPMVFLREHDIIEYWKRNDLVPINACCPLDWVSFRTTVRDTIAILEERHPWFVNKFFDAYRKKLSLKDDIACDEKK